MEQLEDDYAGVERESGVDGEPSPNQDQGVQAVAPSSGDSGAQAVAPSSGDSGAQAVAPSSGDSGTQAVAPSSGDSGACGYELNSPATEGKTTPIRHNPVKLNSNAEDKKDGYEKFMSLLQNINFLIPPRTNSRGKSKFQKKKEFLKPRASKPSASKKKTRRRYTGDEQSRPLSAYVYNAPVDEECLQSKLREMVGSLADVERVERTQANCPIKSLLHHSTARVTLQPRTGSYDDLRQSLPQIWCEGTQHGGNMWLEMDQNKRRQHDPRQKFQLEWFKLGAFRNIGTFVPHFIFIQSSEKFGTLDIEDKIGDTAAIGNDLELDVSFEHSSKSIKIKATCILETEAIDLWGDSESIIETMEMGYNTLEPYVIVSNNQHNCQLFFIWKNRPKLYSCHWRPIHWLFDKEPESVRVTKFMSCPGEHIGKSSVICLSISGRDDNPIFELLDKLELCGFTVFYTHIKHARPQRSEMEISSPIFENIYAWKSLLSLGHTVTDKITQEFLAKVLSLSDHGYLAKILYSIYAEVENDHFGDLTKLFDLARLSIDNTEDMSTDLSDHFCLMPRVVITPTCEMYLQPEPVVKNRIIRQYDHLEGNFLRVVFRDEDFHKVSSFNPDNLNELIEKFKGTLNSGLKIGERHYEFLACSNSQLREHGLWMFASDGGLTPAIIRAKMGELSEIRCVAQYVSRMGQCFSSSKDSTVQIPIVADDNIPDVERRGYCFTDGIGKISESLAVKVANNLEITPVPSAFQIRYAGCKGIVAIDPTLGDSECMLIRKSMKKFESSHTNLEILQHSKPGRLFLNRQAITLLSGLGVRDEVFLQLQEDMLQELAKILIDQESAIKALSQAASGIKLRTLVSQGVSVTVEPFFRSMLEAIYSSSLGDLYRRSRIEIPEKYARIMVGTVDEYELLGPNEVFIQYSHNRLEPQKKVRVWTGDVVITKNPCFHPGDMRKYTAVDMPQLYHMVDCIVFPQTGKRPIPNMMSGSDLDGDMYFVCWYQDLIPKRGNEKPMDFTPPPKQELDHAVEVGDVIEFIGNYIKNDQLGIIANAHLAQADWLEEGIHSDVCKKLAALHSEAVDFPKTGKFPEVDRKLRPLTYPDFMMKRDKRTHKSKRVLGKLFRECRSLETQSSTDKKREIAIDRDLLVDGYENYLGDAIRLRDIYNDKISSTMTMYGIQNEGEMVSGHFLKLKQKHGLLKNERFELSSLVREKMMAIRRRTRIRFFEDFGEEREVLTDHEKRTELLQKASACYFVTYENVVANSEGHSGFARPVDESANIRLLSFPWVFDDLLAQVKHKANSSDTVRSVVFPKGVQDPLQLISTSINKFSQGLAIQQQKLWLDREKVVSSLMKYFSSKNTSAILVGSLATGLFTQHSGIDIYLPRIRRNGLQAVCKDMYLALCCQYKVKPYYGQRYQFPALKMILKDNLAIYITVNSYVNSFNRAAYIKAILTQYPWIVPSVHVLLEWGTHAKLFRDGPIQREHLVVLFLYFLQDIEAMITQPDESVINKVKAEMTQGKNNYKETLDSLCHCNALYNSSQTLINFYRFFSSNEGIRAVGSATDVSMQKHRRLFPNLSHNMKQLIHDVMLKAYHHLVKAVDVREILGGRDGGSHDKETQLDIQITEDVKRMVRHCREYVSYGISKITNTTVAFESENQARLTLVAHGKPCDLWTVKEMVHDLERVKQQTRLIPFDDKLYMQKTYTMVFEGAIEHSESSRSPLCLQPSNGACESEFTPCIFEYDILPLEKSTEGCDFSIFHDSVLRCLEDFIIPCYHPLCHGETITLKASMGKLNLKTTHEIDELGKLLKWLGEEVDPTPVVMGNQKVKRVHNLDPTLTLSIAKTVFHKSVESSSDSLVDSVRTLGYSVDTQTMRTYVVKCKDYSLILDENLKFVELRFPSVSWMTCDVKAVSKELSQLDHEYFDIRYEINTERVVPADDITYLVELHERVQPSGDALVLERPTTTENVNDTGDFEQLLVTEEFRNDTISVSEETTTVLRCCGSYSDSQENDQRVNAFHVLHKTAVEFSNQTNGLYLKTGRNQSQLSLQAEILPRIDKDEMSDLVLQFWMASHRIALKK